MTEYFARKEYIYTTGDTIFSIPFSYIKKEHIKVLINDEETTQYTYLNDTQIRVTQELLLGDVVVIARNTPINDKFVTFTDTSILSSKQQNLSQDQMFDAIQEIYDNNIKFEIDTTETIEENKDDTDAQIEDFRNETNIKVEEINTIANEALLNSNNAIDTANEAKDEADNAVEVSGNANTKSDNAVITANEAKEISINAQNDATIAVDTANNAETTANNAVNTANYASDKVDEFGESIEIVIEAAEKIEEISGAVEEAKTAAATATIAADNAIEAAEAAISALDSKQDKFTVGTGLALENGVLSNTQTSANWGNITGTIENQTDLIDKFNAVDDKIDELQTSKLPNATIIGTPHIEGSYVSGFSESNYLQFPFVDISQGLPFDIYFPFTTGTNVNTQQNILDSYFGIALAIQNGKGVMALSSNGTSWDIGVITGTYNLQPNTTYYAKLSWTGTQYTTALSTDGKTYTTDMTVNSSLTTHKTTIYIGASPNLFGAGTSHPFLGTINFNGSKVIVDNIETWDGYADIGFQTRANVSLSNLDEAGIKFIKDNSGGGLEIGDIGTALYIDETKGLRRYLNGSILAINANTQGFLNWLKGVVTLYPSLATTEENWQAEKTISKLGQCGKFVINETAGTIRLPRVINIQGLVDLNKAGVTIPESLPDHTHTIYSTLFRVAESSSGGYIPRYLANPTYADEGLVNDKASSSNPTYQDNAPVQQEAIQYPYFIQIATGQETEVDIVNEIELNNPFSLFDSRYSDHELNNLSWLRSNGQYNSGTVYVDAYNLLLRLYNGTETIEGISVKAVGDSTITDYDFVIDTANTQFKLPIKSKTSFVVEEGQYSNVSYLYYYVGETVQNASLIDAGRIQEQFAGLRTVVEVSDKSILPSWYRVYSDGWCEQGGVIESQATNPTTVTITFLKSFVDTNYHITKSLLLGSRANSSWDIQYTEFLTKTTQKCSTWMSTSSYNQNATWSASGYIR